MRSRNPFFGDRTVTSPEDDDDSGHGVWRFFTEPKGGCIFTAGVDVDTALQQVRGGYMACVRLDGQWRQKNDCEHTSYICTTCGYLPSNTHLIIRRLPDYNVVLQLQQYM